MKVQEDTIKSLKRNQVYCKMVLFIKVLKMSAEKLDCIIDFKVFI